MRRKNTWCLAVIIGIFCLMLNCAAASVRVNEVMPNPEDNCSNDCTEWIEIYTSSPTNLTNWIINATNQKSNFSFYIEDFLIITKDKINFLNYWSIDSNKVIEWSGMSLLNSGEDIFLFNDSGALISSINYPDFQFHANKSYSLLPNSSWAICSSPTAGLANLCQSQSENQSQQNSTSPPAAVNLSVDYDDEVKGEGFNITVRLYNLKNMKYDIKAYITFEENDTIISQTFDGSWKSSTYYIADAVEGPGSETSEIKMRIKDDYSKFEGDAKINVRIRESETESSIASFEGSVTIKKSEVSNGTSSNQGTISLNLVSDNSSQNTPGITSNVIKLNSETANTTKDIKSNIYKSKVEYFKQYGIYAFAIVCVAVIFVLLKKKKE